MISAATLAAEENHVTAVTCGGIIADDLDIVYLSLLKSSRVARMAVKIYSTEKCPTCGGTFKELRNFSCCGGSRTSRVVIQVTGIKDHPRRRIMIYSDAEGMPLEPLRAHRLKMVIEHEMLAEKFNWRHYAGAVKSSIKWSNYSLKIYLPYLKSRTCRPVGAEGWMSTGAYNDVEKYQRLYLIPLFGEQNIDDLTKQNITFKLDGLKNKSGEYASQSIKRKCVDGIKHMLNFAQARGDIKNLPDMPEVKYTPAAIKTATPAQQAAIIAALPERHRPIFQWLVWSGRRINEARAMKIGDVDFKTMTYRVKDAFDDEVEKPFIKVRAKSGAVLPLDDGIGDKAALLRLAIGDRIGGYVFLNGDKAYTHDALKNIFEDARKAADIDISPNEFGRHSWATQRISEGWSYDQVAMYLLNTAAIVEKNYANITVGVRRAVVLLHQRKQRKLSK